MKEQSKWGFWPAFVCSIRRR